MALRNIFAAGNLPEDLNAAANRDVQNYQPNWFFARLVAIFAALLEGFRTRAHNVDALTQAKAMAHVAADAKLDASANADATLTYAAAGADNKHAITGIVVSYSGSPTGGNVKIKDDTTVVFEVDLPDAGPHVIAFPHPFKGSANKAMSVVLAAGGSGVTGKVNVINHFITRT